MMEVDHPASPEQHLWSSILDSVSSSRAIPSKNVVILGEPTTGKTSIADALLQKSSLGDKPGDGGAGKMDFALGYEWADVKDEAEEDTLARLSVYTIPSSSPAHLSLLPHFLPPKSALPNTLFMIVLDWTRPWTFIEHLLTWLAWIDKWAKGDGARELEVIRDEGRERLQSHLQHYSEPSSTTDTTPLPGGTALSSTLLPLPQGAFTHNPSGVPIIVVCSKADQIDQHQGAPGLGLNVVKTKGGDWEERTDSIMQVLRSICLKYGAALFYTSQAQPISLTQLRSYTLHLLFMPPAPPPDTPPLKYLFPFRQRPNLLDRDRIAVPAGWDSWGKIGVVRDGFDSSTWSEAWDNELEDGPIVGSEGAKEMFKVLVGVEDTDKGPALPPLITTESEQTFLSRNYEILSKDRDPRATFRQPTNPGEQSLAGVVGPLGSSSFNLPSVEKAMIQMEGEDVGSKLARLGGAGVARRDTRPSATLNPLSSSTLQPLANGSRPTIAVGGGSGFSPASPLPGSTGGKSQHEVLQNFFQSLLRDRGGASTTTTNVTPAAAPTNVPPTTEPDVTSPGSPPPSEVLAPPTNGTEEEEEQS